MSDQLWGISLADQAVPVNATDTLTNVKSILELPAPTNQAVQVAYLDLTFDGVPGTAKPVLIQLIRATATGTFTSSGVTPEPFNLDGNSASTLITAANVKFGTASAEGTVVATNGWGIYRVPPTAGILQQIPLGDELWLPKGAFFRIRAVVAAAVNVSINLRWKE